MPNAKSLTLYGLPTCSTCSAALKAFERAGVSVTFRDVRGEPQSPQEWMLLALNVGEGVIDRGSPAYRSLNAFLRAAEVEEQLAHDPRMMARPVISDGTRWTVGWTPEIEAGWLS